MLFRSHYEMDSKPVDFFPTGKTLEEATPVYTELKGWKVDVNKCRNKEDLPQEALDYIAYLEKAVGCPIKYVSVGPDRDDYIDMGV